MRRRCTPDCPLAPYFLPDHTKEFLNAHKLFGVSNILKIIKQLNDPAQKSEAMRSIIFESNMRDRFPVHGCVAAIHTYQLQLHHAQEELDTLNAHLAVYRHRHHQLEAAAVALQPELGTPETLTLFQPQHEQVPAPQSGLLAHVNNNNDIGPAVVEVDHDFCGSSAILWAAPNSTQVQANSCHDNHITSNGNGSSHVISNGINGNYVQGHNDYDVISPYLENIEDRQSYIDSKEVYESRYRYYSLFSPKPFIFFFQLI